MTAFYNLFGEPDEGEPPLDPDCRDGKHGSCTGGPCGCACHDQCTEGKYGDYGPQCQLEIAHHGRGEPCVWATDDPGDDEANPERMPGWDVMTTTFHNRTGWPLREYERGYPGLQPCRSVLSRRVAGLPPCEDVAVWKIEQNRKGMVTTGYYCDADLPEGETS